MKVFGGIFPAFIKIVAANIGTIVAVDDTIGVDHWYDFEDEVLA